MKTTEIGQQGEEMAVRFLMQKGWEIIAQNYRYRNTEIDIIAKDQNTTVFIEVKYRKNNAFGNPEDTVSEQQQQRILKGANHFILKNDIQNDIRFDIISILKSQNQYKITHFEDAFY